MITRDPAPATEPGSQTRPQQLGPKHRIHAEKKKNKQVTREDTTKQLNQTDQVEEPESVRLLTMRNHWNLENHQSMCED